MNCLHCKHCHKITDTQIRCDHPVWEESREGGEDDLEMRTFDPDFGAICSTFELNRGAFES